MSVTGRRRFPYAPGPRGWIGAGFLFLALLCQVGAGILLMWLLLNRDGRVVLPMVGVYLLSFPLLGVAMLLWRVAWRTGKFSSSSLPQERKKALFGTMAVMNIASLAGLAGFLFIAFRLDGTRRFAVALVPLTLSGIVTHAALVKMREIQGRPGPSIFGWAPRQEVAIFGVFSLLASVFLLLAGLFWIPR